MEEPNKYNFKEIIDKFSNKNENDESNSIIVIENKSIDEANNNYSDLSLFSIFEPIVKIKLLNENILLDINFENHSAEGIETLVNNMDLYNELCKQTQYPILNVISLISNDEDKQQLKFINPKFFDKCSDKTGRTINGVRLVYDIDNVMYMPEIDNDMLFEEDEI